MSTPDRKETETRGRELLLKYTLRHGQQDVADRVHVAQSSVSLWVRGISRPEPPIRTLLADPPIRIPATAWLTDEEERFIRRCREQGAKKAVGAGR